ncbi:MAG TPA: rhomboid family intramembrane serine protease [Beijerinckiaceae bacterium]|nr:rhomboid family intramembrane serine protease [Beijerinckiaceae bacterium]
MLVPLHDLDNPVRHIKRPYVNWALIAANVIIFATLQSGLVIDARVGDAFVALAGVIPFEVTTSGQIIPDARVVPETLTLLTYMFLHAGWLHLGGNMLFLWILGDNVEDSMGHGRYFLFYLVCGVAGALGHVLIHPQSADPLIGASGAIAGIVVAYLFLHPGVHLWCLLGRFPIRLRAKYALGGWALMQLGFAVLLTDDGTAWWAHVGGMAAGAALIIVMRRAGVSLFGRAAVGPQAVGSLHAAAPDARRIADAAEDASRKQG